MSSSSSAPDRSLRTLLSESFAVLRDEVPDAHRRVCLELQGHTVAIRVDDESVLVSCEGIDVHVERHDSTARASAEIATTRETIVRVLDGETALVDAVLADAVTARAPLDALVQLNRSLAMYVHGAVRAPSFPGLLQRFRAGG